MGSGLLLSLGFRVDVRGYFAHTIQTDSPIRLTPILRSNIWQALAPEGDGVLLQLCGARRAPARGVFLLAHPGHHLLSEKSQTLKNA